MSKKVDVSHKSKATSERKWAGKLEYFVSLVGYALGISDVWRFPYLVYRNGGGAFLIPFLLTLSTCALPLLYMETEMSQFSGKGPYNVWDMCPILRGIGIACAVFNIADLVPGVLLRVWLIQYIGDSFTSRLPWTDCDNFWNTPTCIYDDSTAVLNTSTPAIVANISNVTMGYLTNATVNLTGANNGSSSRGLTAAEEYWQYRVLQISEGIDTVGAFSWKYLLYCLAVRVLIFICLLKSVKFIGKVMYVTTIIPLVLTLIIWIRAMMLPGAFDGMRFLLKPDLAPLGKLSVWIEAGFMAFYTLGTAWGGFCVMGAHNPFHSNSLRYISITVVLDTLGSLLSAFLVFSVLGVMATESGTDLTNVVSSGMSLTFVTVPKAVTFFPFPQVWIILFLVIVLMVSFDAQMMLLETGLSVIEEAFPNLFQRRRPFLVGIVSLILFVLSIPFMFQNGIYLLQLMDWYMATFTAALIAFLESIAYFWIYGSDRITNDIELMIGTSLPAFIRITGAFFAPILMFLLLLISIVTYKPPNYGPYTYPDYASTIGWMVGMASVVPIIVYAIYEVLSQSGSFSERFRKACQPANVWGPADPKLRENYSLTSVPSWSSKMKCNLLGPPSLRSRRESYEIEEMEKLAA